MPACPNCGRQTLRTEDWACQWCGYPLLSKGYKKIEKTYKQLQEERRLGLSSSESEVEEELEPEMEPEPEPKPRLKPKPQPEPKPRPEPRPQPRPQPEPSPRPRLEPEIKPAARVEPEPVPVSVPKSSPPPELKIEPVAAPEPGPDPKLVFPKLEAASGEIKISVDELNSAYQADKLVANARLKDKVIRVTGLVDKIFVRDHLDIRYIVLTGAGRSTVWNIRCTFGKESVSLLSRLAEGQAATVQGKYDGYGNNIIMKECVLVI